MADEIRNDIVLHENYPFVAMPNVDRLRKEGVTFSNTFCQTPTCCPSRGSVMTGKYPQQLGLYNHSCLLPPEEKTMGHHFVEHGYDAVSFGKTHHMNPGFRSYTYDMEATMGSTNHGYNVDDETAVGIFQKDDDGFCDFVACRQFDTYLENDREGSGRPFLAFIGIYSPHAPLYPPRKSAEMYDWKRVELPPEYEEEAATKPEIHGIPRQRWGHLKIETRKNIIATVLGMCTLVDDCVGRIIASLEQRGILEDTILVFTSDHGDQMGEHGMLGKFYNTYEGSLKVPFVMRIPDRSALSSTGKDFDSLVEMVDIYPTLCDLAGIPQPEGPWSLSGKSLVPVLGGQAAEHRSHVFSMIEHAHMVRTATWKLVLFDNDRSELYNLENDPEERYNLYGSADHRDVQLELATDLLRRLITYRPANHHPGRNTFFG